MAWHLYRTCTEHTEGEDSGALCLDDEETRERKIHAQKEYAFTEMAAIIVIPFVTCVIFVCMVFVCVYRTNKQSASEQ